MIVFFEIHRSHTPAMRSKKSKDDFYVLYRYNTGTIPRLLYDYTPDQNFKSVNVTKIEK